jgi:hypothetical protein
MGADWSSTPVAQLCAIVGIIAAVLANVKLPNYRTPSPADTIFAQYSIRGPGQKANLDRLFGAQ